MQAKESKLTPKQNRFIDEYLIDLNAAQAAIRAGYSKKTARSIGQENLTKPDIQTKFLERSKAFCEKAGITKDRVLLEITRIAFFDPRKIFDETGKLLPIHKWTSEAAACIRYMEIVERVDEKGNVIFTELRKVKFCNKGKLLELAYKYL